MKRPTLKKSPPWWLPIVAASAVGLGFVAAFRGNVQGQATGVAIAVAVTLYVAVARVPRTSKGRGRVRNDVLLLPRRRSYAPLLVLAHATLGFALTSVGVLDKESGRIGSTSRFGDPEALIVAAPVFAVLIVLTLWGAVTGRGRVRLTADAVEWIPMLARTKTCPWGGTPVRCAVSHDALTLNVIGGYRKVVISAHMQRWTLADIEHVIARFAATDASGRGRLIASGSFEPAKEQ